MKTLCLAWVVWTAVSLCRVRDATVLSRLNLCLLIGMMLMPILVIASPRIALPWISVNSVVADSQPHPTQNLHDFNNANPAAVKDTPMDFQSHPVASNITDNAYSKQAMEPSGIPTVDDDRVSGLEMVPTDNQTLVPTSQIQPIESSDRSTRTTSTSTITWVALVVLGTYFVGALAMLARTTIGCLRCTGIASRARRVTALLPSNSLHTDLLPTDDPALSVWQSDEISVPVTVGFWSPKILLPTDWPQWEHELVQIAIAHEREHQRRGDTLTMLLSSFNLAIYWFHPIAWTLQRRLAELAEHVCDDSVILTTGHRHTYAKHLIWMAQRATDLQRQPLLVGMARGPMIEQRIERIIDFSRPLSQRLSKSVASFVALVVIALSVMIAGVTARAQQRENPDSDPSTTSPADDVKPSLSGRVIGPDQKPVAGATVYLRTRQANATRSEPQETTTDNIGRFVFKELPDGEHQLVAAASGMSSRVKRYQGEKVSPDENEIELQLSASPTLQVEVYSKKDQSTVRDAIVRLNWSDIKRDHAVDERGTATIDGLTAEEWSVEVRAPGYAEQNHTVRLPTGGYTTIKSYLDPGASLAGRVVDDAGTPIGDLGLSVFPGDMSGGQIEYVKTQPDGTYRFDCLPMGGLRLSSNSPDHSNQDWQVSLTAKPGETQTLDLTVPRRPDGGSIKGTVVDKDGHPIANASISNHGRSSNLIRETGSDEQGRFHLQNLYSPDELVVQANGYAPVQMSIAGKVTEPPSEIKIVLQPGHSIAGKVVDERGKSIPDVFIVSNGRTGGGLRISRTTKSDVDGRFNFNSLPKGATLDFRKSGFTALGDRELPLDRDDEVVITMPDQGMLRGRAIDESTGKPIPSFNVRITFSPDRKPGEPSGGLTGNRVHEGEAFSSVTGRFELLDLIQGMPLQVTVSAEGYQPAVLRRVVAQRDSEAAADVYRLKPIDPSQHFTLSGKVVDEDGNGIAGLEMRLIACSEQRGDSRAEFPFNWEMVLNGQVAQSAEVTQFLKTISKPDGSFTFANVQPAVDMEIAYWGDGAVRSRMQGIEKLKPDARETLVIRASRGGEVTGKIDIDSFHGISQIQLSGSDGTLPAILSPDKSSYVIKNVPPGTHRLIVYGPPIRADELNGFFRMDVVKRVPCEIEQGQTLQIDLAAVTPPSQDD
ncbi:M56 family metallopeptidase [Stieleria varia]|uniref:M56 family metallopeptidase n=1 Tax=Stieleria varia TaxID=2528005 RepID=UPI001E495869|nr:M56 family metallopeptidase [Stieleria varia]